VAYLALARKYRPQRFADMIGQEHVTRTLENAIKTDRVHHAYLFCGVRGLGKTTAARILAKALVCAQGPTPEPCNECFQCKAINTGHSVDVIEIDGASNNSVDDIRSLRDQVAYLPQSARRKIYIIDEVHMLTQQAFNALLKTLEEPPPHVTFMFATTDPHKVLPTILSRVSRLDYRRVRAATLVPYLQHILELEGFMVEPEGLAVIARCGDGSVRDSLTLLDKVIAFADDPKAIKTAEVLTVLGQAGRFAVAQLVSAVLARDARQVLAHFEEITSHGSDLMQLAMTILQHLRDLAVVKLTGSRDALLDMSDDLYEQLCEQANEVEPTVVAQHFDRFARVVDSLENSRVPRLVIEMGLLELCNAEPLMPLGDLVTRLDALASGRGGGGGDGGGGGRRAPARGPGGGTGRGNDLRAEPASAAPAVFAGGGPTPTPTPMPTPMPARASAAAEAKIGPYEQIARAAGLLSGSTPVSAPPEPQPRSIPTPQPQPGPTTAKIEPPLAAPTPEPPIIATREASTLGPPAEHVASTNLEAPTQAKVQPSSRNEPPRNEPEPPSAFSLSNEPLEPIEPTPRAEDCDVGCPSSRFTPRDAIPWRELQPWDAWESFLVRIRGENTLLDAVLAECGLVHVHEGKIVLAAPATGFSQTQLRENVELRTAFQGLTAEYFGESMRLDLVDAPPTLPESPSLTLVEAERKNQHRQAVARDAERHPKIRSLLGTFGGKLLEIEPLAEPTLAPVGQRGLPGMQA
jgi:DNA polymerase-3 subunit gamma/tau